MLVEFTLASNGLTASISGDHVAEVSPKGTGSAILLDNGTVINVTQDRPTVHAAVNASILPTLVGQLGT